MNENSEFQQKCEKAQSLVNKFKDSDQFFLMSLANLGELFYALSSNTNLNVENCLTAPEIKGSFL